MMASKFGYVLKHYDHDLSDKPEKLIERTLLIEEIGFDSIWITDHILLPGGSRLPRYEKITEIISTLAYLGGITNKIKLGLSTLVLPARNVILAAKQLSTIHYFVGDRLIMTFGAGWAETEFKVLNVGFSDRGNRFNEQLEVMRTLFQGNNEFNGNYYNFKNSELLPRRKGLDALKFYIAGNSNYAVNRAINFGDGWHPVNISPQDLKKVIDKYPEIAKKNIILRLAIDDQPLKETIEQYEDLGIEYFILDDQGDLQIFEKIIDFVKFTKGV